MKLWKMNILLAALVLVLCFAGCGSQTAPAPETQAPTAETTLPPAEETEPPTTVNPLDLVEDLEIVVTLDDIQQLDDYPNLKTLNLSGSTCYDAISAYMTTHPEVEVTYTVSLGDTTLTNHDTDVTLEPGTFDYTLLLENLQHLPGLTRLYFPHISFSAQELAVLQETYPDLVIDYTVDMLGDEYTTDVTELDLSFLTPEEAIEVAPALSLMPNLEYVELVPEWTKSKLGMEDVKVLVDAAPNTNFHYTFTLFGKQIATTDESVEYKNQNIGNDGEDEIRAALDIMTGCTYFKLENCKIDNEILASIRDDYRDKGIKVVWRIWFGKYTAMTDAEKIRAVYNVFDDTCHDLRYCEDVKYIDMGHNDTLTDLSFIGHMPNLEILIASGCAVKDLSGFENCKKLEFLELANCSYLSDLTPLEGCESLKYLNVSYTKVSNLMPLDGLPLERFVAVRSQVPPAEQETFMSIHPDCWTRFLGTQPYGIGWRYDDNGMTYSEIYLKIREIFGYDDMPLEYD